MHKLYELKEKLIDELETYADRGKFTKEDVEEVKYMSSAVDHICNIIDGMDGEYSGSYREGGSYARRRGESMRRDNRGRYSTEGYSRAENDFRSDLEALMENAPTEQMRKKMHTFIQTM